MCTSSRSSTRSLRSHSKASSFFCDLIPTDVSVHHLRLHDQLLPVIFGFYGSYGAALSIPPSSVRVFTDGSAPQQGQHLFMNDIRFYDFFFQFNILHANTTVLTSNMIWSHTTQRDFVVT
jgi:hypothetical protein